MQIYNKRLIIERIKFISRSKNDKELAEKLGVPSASTLANWKNPPKELDKPTFWDYIFNYCELYQTDLNQIVFGKERVNELDAAQQMALLAFNVLNEHQKLQAIAFMTGLQTATAGGVNLTANGNGNNQQVFNGNVEK